MAYIANPSDPDKDKDKQGTDPTNGLTAAGSNAPTSGGSNAPVTGGAPQSSVPQKGSSSGRFTNVSNYINANKNFNGGQGLAGKVAGNISNQANTVAGNINQSQNNFNQQANQSAQGFRQGAQLVNDAISDPSAVANDANKLASFAQARDAKYTGPNGLQDASTLQNNVQNVQGMANQAGTEGGRFGLLRTMFNKPSYTGGQQKLDNLLIQGNQQQLGTLANTRQVANGLNSNLQNSLNQATATGQNLTNEANTISHNTNQALNDANSSAEDAISARTKAEQEKYNTNLNNYKQQFANNDFDANFAGQLGLDPDKDIYNLDLNRYFQYDPNRKAENTTVATSEDYAKMNALAKLQGKEASTEYYDPTQAGTFNKDQFVFNKDLFNEDRNNAESAYHSQYDPAIANFNTADNNIKFDAQRGGVGVNDIMSRGNWINDLISQGRNVSDVDRQVYGNPVAEYNRANQQVQELNKTYTPGRKINVKLPIEAMAQVNKDYGTTT